MYYDNLTPRAQQVMALARKEAERLNHNFVGTEHLLLGILKLGMGSGWNTLNGMNLDLGQVRAEILKLVQVGPDQKVAKGELLCSPRTKKVLVLAAKEAKELKHAFVGSEHILLGLLREGDGVAARVLKHFKVDAEAVRREILKDIAPDVKVADDNAENPPVKAISGLEPDTEKRILARINALESLCKSLERDFLTIEVLGLKVEVTTRVAACLLATNDLPLSLQERVLLGLLQNTSKE